MNVQCFAAAPTPFNRNILLHHPGQSHTIVMPVISICIIFFFMNFIITRIVQSITVIELQCGGYGWVVGWLYPSANDDLPFEWNGVKNNGE